MIISASRRTDIPAFYSEWLLTRLRAGFVHVRNPRNPRQTASVDLSPAVVDCIVFWTKNAGPMLDKLTAIEKMGYAYYFQYTLTPYDQRLEPGLAKAAAIDSFKQLGDKIGRQRLIWRYDPVIINADCTVAYHLERFGALCAGLSAYTGTCVISFIDLYRKLRKRAAGMIDAAVSPPAMRRLVQGFAAIAGEYQLRLAACAEEDFAAYGLAPAACIDRALIEQICGNPLQLKKASGQRANCRCAASIDIGAYDCCPHGCLYCYATTSRQTAEINRQRHDPASPLLIGYADGEVKTRPVKSLKTAQLQLF